jgi:hypothetical protein
MNMSDDQFDRDTKVIPLALLTYAAVITFFCWYGGIRGGVALVGTAIGSVLMLGVWYAVRSFWNWVFKEQS